MHRLWPPPPKNVHSKSSSNKKRLCMTLKKQTKREQTRQSEYLEMWFEGRERFGDLSFTLFHVFPSFYTHFIFALVVQLILFSTYVESHSCTKTQGDRKIGTTRCSCTPRFIKYKCERQSFKLEFPSHILSNATYCHHVTIVYTLFFQNPSSFLNHP